MFTLIVEIVLTYCETIFFEDKSRTYPLIAFFGIFIK